MCLTGCCDCVGVLVFCLGCLIYLLACCFGCVTCFVEFCVCCSFVNSVVYCGFCIHCQALFAVVLIGWVCLGAVGFDFFRCLRGGVLGLCWYYCFGFGCWCCGWLLLLYDVICGIGWFYLL